MEGLRISAVVPTFNGRALVERTLATLFAQAMPAGAFEVIAVVDGSTDGTGAALRALDAPCAFRVIEQENRGPAAARNAGWRVARGEIVLFVDGDMLCDAGLVAAHLAAHEEGDRLAAFGSLFLSEDSPRTLAAECFNHEIGAMHLAHRSSAEAEWRLTDCVFSNSSIGREVLEEFGGFDERFRMREDLELGLRLLRAGVRAKYVPAAKAYQYYAKSTADLMRDAEAFGRADALLAETHPGVVIAGHVRWLERQKGWKLRVMRLAARAPGLWDVALKPVCAVGERFFGNSRLRGAGMRALQIRRRLRWLRSATRDSRER